MKILVTGGAGFIGSNVVDGYVREGHEVVVVDDLSSGKRENVNPSARLHVCDIRSAEIQEIMAAEKPDLLNHHAAQVSVPFSVTDPVKDADINIKGLLNLLQNAVRSGVKKVIFISSGGAVYGEAPDYPTPESCPPLPLSPYAISKFVSERYVAWYRHAYGLQYTILRYANVYGPRQNPHGEAGVVALFARKMLSGERPTIYGSGDKTRAYVFVEEVARANLLALESESQGVFNIGTSVRTSDQAVFDLLREELKYDGRARYEPVRLGEIAHMSLDHARAREKLGWEPIVGFAEGIRKSAAFYAERYVRVNVAR